MDELYPPESQNLDVIGHLDELRRRIIICLGVILLGSIIAFALGAKLLPLIEKPAHGLITELIFITPTEVFMVYLKVSLLTGFILSFPLILYQGWAFLAPAVSRDLQSRIIVWLVLGLILFVGGICFSYWVALPVALKFLMNFGRDFALPYITVDKYFSFFIALIFIGGIIFEIPIVIGLLTDIGLLQSRQLIKQRKFAFLGIFIVAALITPTQDIVNMLIFALPMLLLYEIGLILSRMIEARKLKKRSVNK